QGAYRDVTKALKNLQRDAKKANKTVLSDFDKLKAAVADKAPTRSTGRSSSARKTTARKTTSSKSSTRSTSSRSTGSRSTGSRARNSSSS
ncbi:MAG: hypothetical protein ACXVFH_19705, partial [Solirubrobacteraceae bacterium]